MTRLFRFLIRVYSVIVSPLLGRNCRYHPTCSAYADEALKKHGSLKGGYLTFRRVSRCHPWCKHDYHDPVPEDFSWKQKKKHDDNNNRQTVN
ncbi:MAG: membrane protein insertion efficiency factor YidD [Alcanivorax sp.]